MVSSNTPVNIKIQEIRCLIEHGYGIVVLDYLGSHTETRTLRYKWTPDQLYEELKKRKKVRYRIEVHRGRLLPVSITIAIGESNAKSNE